VTNINNNLEFLAVSEAEAISEVSSLNPFEIVDIVSNLENEELILKYILYAIKFQESTIFCGLFQNPRLSDDHIGRLHSHFVSKIVIDFLVVSSPYASSKTILEVLSSAFYITYKAVALREQLDEKILSLLCSKMTHEIKDILLIHPNLSDVQKVEIALRHPRDLS
jgi:hypothetical protein